MVSFGKLLCIRRIKCDEAWCIMKIINDEMLWCGKADLTDFKYFIPDKTSAIIVFSPLYDLWTMLFFIYNFIIKKVLQT